MIEEKKRNIVHRKKYGVLIGIILAFVCLLVCIQWYGNRNWIQKIGSFTKEYLEEEQSDKVVVSGMNFTVTERELGYTIVTERLKKSRIPEQAGLEKVIVTKLSLLAAEKEGISLTEEELEKKKAEDPLSFLGLSGDDATGEFFRAWDSREEGEHEIENILIYELLSEKYWNKKQEEFLSNYKDLPEQEQQEKWEEEQNRQIIEMIKSEKITNNSGIVHETYGKYFVNG